MALKSKHEQGQNQNVYFVKQNRLPPTAPPNSIYVTSDTKKIYLYGEDRKPTLVGAAEGDKNYFYEQTTASAVWNIVHNLNKRPAVSVINSAGDEVYGQVTYISENQLVIRFQHPFSGKATLN